jgi:hypothetical protein
MACNRLKKIASEENYLVLKKSGGAGDFFYDIITEILKQNPQTGPSRATSSVNQNANLEHDYIKYE